LTSWPATPVSWNSSRMLSTMARAKSSTLDDTFFVWTVPASSRNTMSVNVPPMSTPTRKRAISAAGRLEHLGDVGVAPLLPGPVVHGRHRRAHHGELGRRHVVDLHALAGHEGARGSLGGAARG